MATRPGSSRRTKPKGSTVTQALATAARRHHEELLEAGVHFGHQTRRWNPKMKRFIFGERNGIYIIDLQQTLERIDAAYRFVRKTVENGGTVLFVGTKKQAQEPIQRQADRSNSALRELPLAGRHAHQLPDGAPACRRRCASSRRWWRRARPTR